MTTYIALLRAVNVGGIGKFPMTTFREILEGLGYANVATYIQSGNAVFDAKGTAGQIGKAIATAIEKQTQTKVEVMVRTHDDLGRIIADNPFAAEAAADGARVFVAFLAAAAPASAKAGLDQIVAKYPNRRDRFHLAGDVLYLHLPDGAADTKFSGKTMDKAVGVAGTARNWNTVLKLHAMSDRGKS